jgi:hypothetical protein
MDQPKAMRSSVADETTTSKFPYRTTSSTHLHAETASNRSSSLMIGGPLCFRISSSVFKPTTNTSPNARACRLNKR